jgi:hypothetical protein
MSGSQHLAILRIFDTLSIPYVSFIVGVWVGMLVKAILSIFGAV